LRSGTFSDGLGDAGFRHFLPYAGKRRGTPAILQCFSKHG